MKALLLMGVVLLLALAGGLWYLAMPPVQPSPSVESAQESEEPAAEAAWVGEVSAGVPAGTLNIETAKAGERYGAWTAKENTFVFHKGIDIDGEVYKGWDGEISMEGAIQIAGRYQTSDLNGGIGVTLDSEYLAFFPRIVDNNPEENEVRDLYIGLFDFNGKGIGDSGHITLVITDLRYVRTLCTGACDAYRGFSAKAVRVVSDVPDKK